MKKIENQCVSCDVCYHCGRKQVEVLVCDECKNDAQYETNEGDFCEDCFTEMLNNIWEQLSLEEKAKALGIEIY